ncbi:MAG: hypothetical protein H7301_08660 [Cryobacterium sp.]|nr:hypothetical protein [Oligoflexia bacterium]
MLKKSWTLFSGPLFLSLISTSAFAGYDCSVVARKQGVVDGKPVADFYPSKVPAAGAQVISQEDVGTEMGNFIGDAFIVESKTSNISFGEFISYAPEEQMLKIAFGRNSKPNRNGVMSQHDALAEVEIHGSGSKVLFLDGGKYRLVVTCAVRI